MAATPAGCICNDPLNSPRIASAIDRPRPHPGQKSTPERLNKQKVGESTYGLINATKINPQRRTIHSKW